VWGVGVGRKQKPQVFALLPPITVLVTRAPLSLHRVPGTVQRMLWPFWAREVHLGFWREVWSGNPCQEKVPGHCGEK
jgi:hypothetical protein